MPFYGFRGGVHPSYQKSATSGKPIEVVGVEEGELYTIPLSQHIGAPAKAIVAKNQQVKAGEKIGESGGFVSANVHSSVNGTVVGLEDIKHPIMGKVPGVVIRAEGENAINLFEPLEDTEKFTNLVLNAGITGMGGATFPSHVKLSPPKDIDTLIINGAECEPFLTCDHRLMVEETEKVVQGALLVQKNLGIGRVIIGVEENKPDAIEAFRQLQSAYQFELVPLDVKYPQGGEKQLIKATVDRIVPEGKLPMEVGVIVHNVGTMISIFEAVHGKKPLIERVVTVTGAVKEPKNLMVKIGTPISKLIEVCGGFAGDARKVVLGGPMMGFSISSLEIPVMKGTSGILAFREMDLPNMRQRNCIRCGRCVDVCPMNLIPANMEQFAVKEMYDELADWHVLNCIECGCCSYVCPSRRTLVGSFKTAKRHVANVLRQREQNAK